MSLRKKILILFAILLTVFASSFSYYAAKKPNIILMIGDGMGVATVYAGLTGNHGTLALQQFRSVGFSKTYSASNYTTDSGAGGTALATGHKTYNGAIGVGADSLPVKSVLEYAEDIGYATGLVATSSITDATPASFIAHVASRYDLPKIALDFLKTDIDVFIGGGRNDFAKRPDGLNLIDSLRARGYQVMFSIDSIKNVTSGKLAGLTAEAHNLTIDEGRGDMLLKATETALNILDNNKKGFFLMVEGSHIDKEAHAKDSMGVVEEMIDFDKVVGKVLEFAKKDGNTLVIVTADHETGGITIPAGNFETGKVVTVFDPEAGHTGVMVPVFAYGPGAEKFQGIQENTDIFYKMLSVLGIKAGQ
jgi:alkaline phosphatase